MWNNHSVNCEIWCYRIKWNEINPLTPAGISHCEAIFHTRSVFHKSRKGFISLKKNHALSDRQSVVLFLVRGRGLEPPWYSPHAPQTCASADSATLAYKNNLFRLRVIFYQNTANKSSILCFLARKIFAAVFVQTAYWQMRLFSS